MGNCHIKHTSTSVAVVHWASHDWSKCRRIVVTFLGMPSGVSSISRCLTLDDTTKPSQRFHISQTLLNRRTFSSAKLVLFMFPSRIQPCIVLRYTSYLCQVECNWIPYHGEKSSKETHLDPGHVMSEGSVLDCPPRRLGMSSVEGTPSALLPPWRTSCWHYTSI